MDFSRIIDHPVAEEIVDKLVHGTTPKDVSDWLKLKYAGKDQAHLRLAAPFLQDFVNGNLNLYETLRKDIVNSKVSLAQEKKVSASLLNNKSYQERLVELAEEEVDLKTMLGDLLKVTRSRLEQVFDSIQEDPYGKGKDLYLDRYINTLAMLTDKYDKIVNKSPDQIIQHNVTVQVMDQYMGVLQESVREILADMEPDLAFSFMDKLNAKLEKVQLPDEVKSLAQSDRLKEAKLLSLKLAEPYE